MDMASSSGDYAALGITNTELPLSELFRQVTSSAGGAFGLTFVLFIALAFSRDGAMPYFSLRSRINHRYGVPFNAQILVTASVAALGCIYLGSSTAFNSMLGSAVTINNMACLIPIATNMLTDRRYMFKGHFYMGKWAWFVNGVTVTWLIAAIVFSSFPYSMPVTVQSMNYTCVVVGSLPLLIPAWWFFARGRYRAKIAAAKEE
ncbi:hypothetical protein GQ53DRAFT_779347 [Thozetella sp. PMI_491]|nr:hypothetical protein GQ53DRAFT_779347 [Thozetella sp. PMI_491]